MTVDERFQQIEATLSNTVGLLHSVVASQARTQETLSGLAESISRSVDAADEHTKGKTQH